MCGTAILFLSFLLYEKAFSTYSDQRQTGDLNVQIDLKNLQVIALMKGKEEYVDYDYAYDYSDITIKPQNGTTKKPLNVTEASTEPNKDNITSTTVSSVPELITTLSTVYSHVTTQNEPVFKSTPFPTTILQENNNNNSNITVETTTVSKTSNTALPADNCKKGFVRNSNGTCELILQNPSNTLLKMLKQKSKPRNELRKA